MTDKEKAVVMAFTGVTMLSGDKFSIFHKYVEDIMGRPVFTHGMANREIARQIKEKALPDFLKICKDEFEEDPEEAYWKLENKDEFEEDQEAEDRIIKTCRNCKYYDLSGYDEPCNRCIDGSLKDVSLKDEEDPEEAYWKLEKFGVFCCSCGSSVAIRYDPNSDSIKPEDAYCPHCGKKWKGEKK